MLNLLVMTNFFVQKGAQMPILGLLGYDGAQNLIGSILAKLNMI